MGRSISGLLTPNTLVMGKLTADLRGAAAGDTITLIASSGAATPFTIAAVVDDATLGGTEMLMSPGAADRLGILEMSQVVIWDFSSRAAIDAALSAQGLVNTRVRIRRSWDAFDPDLTLGMARTKAPSASSRTASIRPERSRSTRSGPTCTSRTGHQRSEPGVGVPLDHAVALQAAMDEVVASGLAGTINYYDANRPAGASDRDSTG